MKMSEKCRSSNISDNFSTTRRNDGGKNQISLFLFNFTPHSPFENSVSFKKKVIEWWSAPLLVSL